ncbi:MAG: CotH kinase family protein [Flavobacterium sp.]|nr:CotH kinase family protein [Flavobacterium sp.]
MKNILSKSRLSIFNFAVLVLFILSHQKVTSQNFTDSNLPIVIINTDDAQEIPDDPRIFGNMKIIYKGEGVQNLITDQNTPAYLNYNGRISIEIRGSSSQALPKKGYGLTTLMPDNSTNNNVSLLGMPSENDWILNGLAFDPSLIRDYLSYNLSRQIGNYAPRTAYCEVVINGEYVGLYLLQEKIKADSNRVDVTKITNTQNTAPLVTGGYITKADKTTGNDPVAWSMASYTGGYTNFIHDLPKPENVTSQQDTYIHNQFTKLEITTSVDNISFINGYPSVIDVPSFVDFMVSNELASNADGYELSSYFHKDRNGKLRAGPIWDFNLTYGNDLFLWGFDRSHYDVWQFSNGDNEGAKFWTDLYNNPQFKCYFSKRWNEVTQAGQPMNLASMETFIDNTVAYIYEASLREDQKWGTVPDIYTDTENIKSWLSSRTDWMNSQLDSFSNCNNVTVPSLVICKINYNPSTNGTFTNSNDQEFIAIKNTGTTTVNMTGVYFRGTGFVYQFPVNQILPANSTVYLASKATVFLNRYGFAANGEFTRNMSNSDQDIVLADGFGNVIDHVHYYDSEPWPDADGNGSYLQLTDVILDNNLASSWIATDSNTLGTGDFDFTADDFVKLAPNPTTDLLQVKTPNAISQIEIVDSNGRIIQTLTPNSNAVDINLSKLASGMYMIKVISQARTSVRKIIVQ